MNSDILKRLNYHYEALNGKVEKLKIEFDENKNLEVTAEAYTCMCEIVFWIITTNDWYEFNGLDDYKTKRNKDKNGQLILGLRYVFNRIKHNMNFLKLHYKSGGFQFPIQFPFESPEWEIRWIPISFSEEEDRYKNQLNNYQMYLQDKLVIDTFDNAINFLKDEYKRSEF